MICYGEIVDNQRICDEFEVANTGGIRVNRNANHIVLIATTTGSTYSNQWVGDVLHFAGSGANQHPYKLERQNKSLALSSKNSSTIYIFTKLGKRQYRYEGIFELVAAPDCMEQTHVNGDYRFIWIFPLRRVSCDSGGSLKSNTPEAIHTLKMNRWHRAVLLGAACRVKVIIREMKDRARKQKRNFGFAADELDLGGADESRLREVLDMIGQGDQFDQIMELAREEVPMPNAIGLDPASIEAPVISPIARKAKCLNPSKLDGWS